MMGRQMGDQSQLFYLFNLEQRPGEPFATPYQSDSGASAGRSS